MSVSRKFKSQKGFTLVELLIVVAIIGVLSTVGVPTFRRMVQKAKKSEAKVNLAGLYTAESAFFAEYGAYGNHLEGIGFDASGASFNYNIGFFNTAGASYGAAAIRPAVGNAIGININQVFTAYYNPTADAEQITRVGRRVPSPIATNVNDAQGSTFVAGAVGPIAPGVTAAGGMDVWRINHNRALLNCQDGVGRNNDSPDPAVPCTGDP